jgi:hypothetical protein
MSEHGYPIFVDGQKIAEATQLSYSINAPVEYKGSGLPGTPTVVEQDPPEYLIEAELPVEAYAPIDHESRVEVAFPPSDHGGSGWRVVEVWEIHQFEITNGSFELATWQGEVHDGVDYLGFDTDRVVDDQKLVEAKPGIALRIDTKHDSDQTEAILDASEPDDENTDGFSADVHNI